MLDLLSLLWSLSWSFGCSREHLLVLGILSGNFSGMSHTVFFLLFFSRVKRFSSNWINVYTRERIQIIGVQRLRSFNRGSNRRFRLKFCSTRHFIRERWKFRGGVPGRRASYLHVSTFLFYFLQRDHFFFPLPSPPPRTRLFAMLFLRNLKSVNVKTSRNVINSRPFSSAFPP